MHLTAAIILAAVLFACGSSRVPLSSSEAAPILLFNGAGTAKNDVAALEAILNRKHLAYSTADTAQLNGLSESRLAAYRLLIVPGGNFIEIGEGLSSRTEAKIHDAVHGGVGYLGICAGGFLAGKIGDGGFDLASGTRFKFYAAEERGIRKAAVAITSAGSPTLEQYWEDGPQFTGWGAVVGRYPDGTPAIVEGASGKGWVVLSGVHAEAPESWRRGMTFATPASADEAYAATLINAALRRTLLPHD